MKTVFYSLNKNFFGRCLAIIKAIDLIFVIIIKIVSCKIFGIFTSAVVFRRLYKDSDFSDLSTDRLNKIMFSMYLPSALLSTAVAFFILRAWNFSHSLMIALFLFGFSALFTGIRYHGKESELLLKMRKLK